MNTYPKAVPPNKTVVFHVVPNMSDEYNDDLSEHDNLFDMSILDFSTLSWSHRIEKFNATLWDVRQQKEFSSFS